MEDKVMDKCENCQQMENRLKERLGLKITIPMLRDLGIIIEMVKPTRTCACGQRHYAKGYCYAHYMKELRQVKPIINELGQHISRKGKVLCDFEGCDYAMEQRFQGKDSKWYCSVHLKDLGQVQSPKLS